MFPENHQNQTKKKFTPSFLADSNLHTILIQLTHIKINIYKKNSDCFIDKFYPIKEETDHREINDMNKYTITYPEIATIQNDNFYYV